MQPPRILLIGKLGQVGWELRRALAPLGQLLAIDYPEIDLTDGQSITRWIRESQPRLVVNAAAHTAVDKAESEPERAMEMNGVAPGILAEECRRLDAWLVHYSTDYVFDGAKHSPYVEEDRPNPLGAYGRSKLAGDQAIAQVDGRYLILRLCWVYGARGQNFLLTMIGLAREREKLRVVRDQIGAPTWSRMIAEATAHAAHRVLADAQSVALKGTYHVSAAGQTSWHGFTERIVSLMRPDDRKCREVEAITAAEYPTAAKRPANSVMNNDKFARTFGLRLPPWEESLEAVMDELRPTP